MIDFPFRTGFVIYISLISLILGFVTLFILLLNRFRRTIRRFRRKYIKYISLSQNVFRFILTIFWIAISAAILFLAAFIQSYQSFTKKELVAEVRCLPLEDRKGAMFLELTPVNAGQIQEARKFLLNGDQWALEGDILKWDDWVNFIGLHTMFKLTRVRGRYVNYQDEIRQPPSVYSLVEREDDPQWRWLFKYGHKLRFVSAVYGNTVYTYPSENNIYEIYVTTSGFMAGVREE
ncbi:MAG: hypothetical protein ACE5HX_03175 [bacterium]